jgi:hypothetical protein
VISPMTPTGAPIFFRFAPLFLAACGPKGAGNVNISGRLLDGPGQEALAVVPQATVRTLSLFDGPVDQTTTDAQGDFDIQAPALDSFFFQFEKEGHVPTALAATAGTEDTSAPAGSLWIRTQAAYDQLLADFAGCPGAEPGATLIEGIVKLYPGDVQESWEEWPILTTAELQAEDPEGEFWTPCYLSAGGTYDPDADLTGELGRFAFFGLPPGQTALRIRYAQEDGLDQEDRTLVLLPEGGTAPLYPAYATLPY